MPTKPLKELTKQYDITLPTSDTSDKDIQKAVSQQAENILTLLRGTTTTGIQLTHNGKNIAHITRSPHNNRYGEYAGQTTSVIDEGCRYESFFPEPTGYKTPQTTLHNLIGWYVNICSLVQYSRISFAQAGEVLYNLIADSQAQHLPTHEIDLKLPAHLLASVNDETMSYLLDAETKRVFKTLAENNEILLRFNGQNIAQLRLTERKIGPWAASAKTPGIPLQLEIVAHLEGLNFTEFTQAIGIKPQSDPLTILSWYTSICAYASAQKLDVQTAYTHMLKNMQEEIKSGNSPKNLQS